MRIRPIALCLGLSLTPGLVVTAHAGYDVTILQDPPRGAGYTNVNAINDAGQSVGSSYIGPITDPVGLDAVLWPPTGKGTVLQDAGGQGYSNAEAINDAGESVGYSFTARGTDAVLWSPSGSRAMPATVVASPT